MPYKFGPALVYAVLLWLSGFIWGSIVFMTPTLKSTAGIPYISRNPAISFPILIIWVVLTHLLAKAYLKAAHDKSTEGLRLGLVFAGVNFALDFLILVLLLQAGFSYFVSATVWLAYFILIFIPWMTGRASERTAA